MRSDYELYRAVLIEKMNEYIFLLVCAIIVFIVIFFVGICKQMGKSYFTILAIGIVVFAISFYMAISPYSKDLNNNSFVTYNGEVTVHKVWTGKSIGWRADISFTDNDKPKQFDLYKRNGLEEGKWFGTLVYSENSRIVFFVDFDS